VICGSRSIGRYPHRTCLYFSPSAAALTGPAVRDMLDRPYGLISKPKWSVAYDVRVQPGFMAAGTAVRFTQIAFGRLSTLRDDGRFG